MLSSICICPFLLILFYSSYGNVFYMGIESWQLKGVALISICRREVKKKANIRNRCNQVPHMTYVTYGKVIRYKETSHIREPRGQPYPNK